MNTLSFLAVGVGAAVGAWLRWLLSALLNPMFPSLPLGTLAANLIGGYLIGVAMAVFEHHVQIPAEVRLLIITGFLGGLTTFSSFSAEVVLLMAKQELAWAFGVIAAHLGGSLVMTMLGIWSIKALIPASA